MDLLPSAAFEPKPKECSSLRNGPSPRNGDDKQGSSRVEPEAATIIRRAGTNSKNLEFKSGRKAKKTTILSGRAGGNLPPKFYFAAPFIKYEV